jgi:hypothetical protein
MQGRELEESQALDVISTEDIAPMQEATAARTRWADAEDSEHEFESAVSPEETASKPVPTMTKPESSAEDTASMEMAAQMYNMMWCYHGAFMHHGAQTKQRRWSGKNKTPAVQQRKGQQSITPAVVKDEFMSAWKNAGKNEETVCVWRMAHANSKTKAALHKAHEELAEASAKGGVNHPVNSKPLGEDRAWCLHSRSLDFEKLTIQMHEERSQMTANGIVVDADKEGLSRHPNGSVMNTEGMIFQKIEQASNFNDAWTHWFLITGDLRKDELETLGLKHLSLMWRGVLDNQL